MKQENGLDNPDDDVNFNMAVQRQIYNPLDDTRPYYYATYRNVRGTAQVYAPVNGSSASTYVIDGSKGDEFQMNSRTTEWESFMDILNRNAVVQGQKRIYGNGDYEVSTEEGLFAYYVERLNSGISVSELTGSRFDSNGESPLMPYLMNARDFV